MGIKECLERQDPARPVRARQNASDKRVDWIAINKDNAYQPAGGQSLIQSIDGRFEVRERRIVNDLRRFCGASQAGHPLNACGLTDAGSSGGKNDLFTLARIRPGSERPAVNFFAERARGFLIAKGMEED